MTRRSPDHLAPHLLRLGAGLPPGAAVDPAVIALDRCAAGRVRVPPGAVLVGTAYGEARAAGRPQDQAWPGADPGAPRTATGADLGTPRTATVLEVRLAATLEVRLAAAPLEGPDGGYLTAVRVGSADGPGLARAVRELTVATPLGHHNVLVLAAPAAIHAGTAVAVWGGSDDDVVAVEVTAEAQRAATGWRPRELRLPRLTPGRRAHQDVLGVPLPPWGMRLARQLRRVRRALGPDGWTIAWADNGRACWVRGATRGTCGGRLRR